MKSINYYVSENWQADQASCLKSVKTVKGELKGICNTIKYTDEFNYERVKSLCTDFLSQLSDELKLKTDVDL